MVFSTAHRFVSLLAHARGRVVVVLAASVGLLGLWALVVPGEAASASPTITEYAIPTASSPVSVSFNVTVNYVFSGGVIYAVSRANTDNLKAYQEGTWTLLGEWTVPALEQKAYSQKYMTTARGTAYDNGTLFVATGNYKPQSSGTLSGQVVAWDLVNDKQLWDTTFTGDGVDQLAACNGYVYVPRGENSTSDTWSVLSESTGAVLGSITGPTPGPHNTICAKDSAGEYHVFLGGRCGSGCTSTTPIDLGQQTCSGTSCTSQVNVGPKPSGTGLGVRPFTVGEGLTRAWITWTHYRGFSIADLGTGKLLTTINFGAYSSSCSALTSQSHGISVSPDDSEVYVIDAPAAMVRVYSGADSPAPITNVSVDPWCGATETSTYCGGPGCTPDGWLQHTLDGNYVLVGGSGDVIRTSDHTVVVNSMSTGDAGSLYTDLRNNEHGFIAVNWSGGVPTAGNHFGIGR